MDILVRNIKMTYTAPDTEIVSKAMKKLSGYISKKEIVSGSVYKKSIDARHRDNILFVSTVLFTLADGVKIDGEKLARYDAVILKDDSLEIEYGKVKSEHSPVVVGFGPAGMFCAMLLAENGYKPIVIERGEGVKERRLAVERFYKTGVLNSESNIQFGAGGAGTFSDGKLITRINDSKCRYVLEKFVKLGAPKEILINAKPHIGTDRLLDIVDNVEKEIVAAGGKVMYNTAAVGFKREGGKIVSVMTKTGEIPCSCVVLATGHSARDMYSYLMGSNFTIVPKPFSVGVRIEHLQREIDEALFGSCAGDERLGHAEYSLSRRENGRGVYSFCMCPGGEVVAGASEEGGVVTNGMSRFDRDGVNANSAIVVDVKPSNPMAFQRELERKAFEAGGGNYFAPVEKVGDFLSGKAATEPTIVKPSYMGGDRYRPFDLTSLFTSDITEMLKTGISYFGKIINGFDADYALLTGVETRTSAPYRLMRGESKASVDVSNLYPCGEGAGYAGGITSAAVDGLAVALEIMKIYSQK